MNGVYGTKRPANITSNDVDIFYHYRPTRNSDSKDFSQFKRLDSNILSSVSGICNDEQTQLLPGMYDLRLPVKYFSKKGIYTVYIKPKEIYTEILDVSTLIAYPNIRGIVINTSKIGEAITNNSLVGYRVEYYSMEDSKERLSDFRIITSNNLCEPVAQNVNDSMQKGIRYRFNDSSTLMFCTLTPSTAMSFKSSSLPFIGNTNQKIALINTKFNPICLEIEMVEHDDDTISLMLEGTQLRNLDKGLITTFNEDGDIYHQASYGNITNTNENINHDFKKENKDNIIFQEQENLKKIEEVIR